VPDSELDGAPNELLIPGAEFDRMRSMISPMARGCILFGPLIPTESDAFWNGGEQTVAAARDELAAAGRDLAYTTVPFGDLERLSS
jgi:hypothetical protein